MKYLICCLFLFLCLNLRAQDKMSNVVSGHISNIKDIELIINNGGMTGFYTQANIIPENGKWHAQRKKIEYFEKDSISDIFTHEVSSDSIKLLIRCLFNPSPRIKTSSFNLNRDSLIKYYRASERVSKQIPEEKFLKRIDDSVFVQGSLTSLCYPRFRMDHEASYKIIIRFNKGPDLVVFSKSGNSPYYLPWKQSGINYFNPNITRLFDYLCGYDGRESSRKIWLYRRLVNQLGKPSLGN